MGKDKRGREKAYRTKRLVVRTYLTVINTIVVLWPVNNLAKKVASDDASFLSIFIFQIQSAMLCTLSNFSLDKKLIFIGMIGLFFVDKKVKR